MSQPGIEPATLGFHAGHLDRFAIGTVVYLRVKLFQNHALNPDDNTFTFDYGFVYQCNV